jgi:hypothetical protein
MRLKKVLLTTSAVLTLVASAKAGDFSQYEIPLSNPVFNHDARNYTMIRPILIHQNLPDKVEFRSDIKRVLQKYGLYDAARKVGGDVQGMALAFNYAFNERFSIVAVKDGYIDCEPSKSSLIGKGSGYADVAAGIQYSPIYKPEKEFIFSVRGVYEIPVGTHRIYQGRGDGTFNISGHLLKGFKGTQLSGSFGFILPVNDHYKNTLFYHAWHLGHNLTPWLHPFVEFNHFYVIDAGKVDLKDVKVLRDLGITNAQALDNAINTFGAPAVVSVLKQILHSGEKDKLVAALTSFSGCDIVNLGGAHNDENRNFVTAALGFRVRPMKNLSIGFAYEFPLTKKEEGLLKDRFLLDAVYRINF